jgi:hypothetical protein
MSRLVIIIPFFKRHSLTKVVFRHYRLLQRDWQHGQIELLAVGSEGDVSRHLAESEGLDYIECANRPLDAKYECGFLCAQEYHPDAVALVGSNDIISGEYFANAMTAFAEQGVDSTGLLDCYLVDLPTRRMSYWPGYSKNSIGYHRDGTRSRQGESIAAGRTFSRNILEKMHWRPFLADQRISEDLLNDDETNIDCLNNHAATILNWRMADVDCHYWNIKSEFDLNPFSAFELAYGADLKDVGDQTQAFWACHYPHLLFASSMPRRMLYSFW